MTGFSIPVYILTPKLEEFYKLSVVLRKVPHFSAQHYKENGILAFQTALLISSKWILDEGLDCRHFSGNLNHPVFLYGLYADCRASFTLGCTDFIRYPFNSEELTSRLFRSSPIRIQFPDKRILSLYNGVISGKGRSCTVSDKEASILRLLAEFSPDPVPRSLLFETIFSGLSETSRYPDIVMSSLRKKIMKITDGSGLPISSVHGVGYKL